MDTRSVRMLQLFLHLIPVALTGFLLYMLYRINAAFTLYRAGGLMDLCCIFQRTPALDTFVLFILQGLLAVGTVVFCVFGRIGNHGILTLDILYFFSTLLLIAYHMLKESFHPLVKAV